MPIKNPRDAAMLLVEDGEVAASAMLVACLKYMSQSDVLDMMQLNEMLELVEA